MNDFTLNYRNTRLQVLKEQLVVVRPREAVTVLEKLNGTLELWLRQKQLSYSVLGKIKPTRTSAVKFVDQEREEEINPGPLYTSQIWYNSSPGRTKSKFQNRN